MIDLVCSTLEGTIDASKCRAFKRAAFEAVIEEELEAKRCRQSLLHNLQNEIAEKFGEN